MWLRMIAGGGGNGLYAEQPEVNIMRGAYYALIGALAGAQTMALCCYDEAYTIPSEFAQRLSLRTMQLLIEESGLCDTVDPLAGVGVAGEALTALAEAREWFLDLRGLIELTYSDERRIEQVLGAEGDEAVTARKEYLPAIRELQERNVARAERLAGKLEAAANAPPGVARRTGDRRSARAVRPG